MTKPATVTTLICDDTHMTTDITADEFLLTIFKNAEDGGRS